LAQLKICLTLKLLIFMTRPYVSLLAWAVATVARRKTRCHVNDVSSRRNSLIWPSPEW